MQPMRLHDLFRHLLFTAKKIWYQSIVTKFSAKFSYIVSLNCISFALSLCRLLLIYDLPFSRGFIALLLFFIFFTILASGIFPLDLFATTAYICWPIFINLEISSDIAALSSLPVLIYKAAPSFQLQRLPYFVDHIFNSILRHTCLKLLRLASVIWKVRLSF